MAVLKLNINGKVRQVDVDPEMPLLWVLRDTLGMCGTKYGCGIMECGACTVHIDGDPIKSCGATAESAVGKKIITIEGLGAAGDHPVQTAWIAEDVPQCGWCQVGMVMAASALLKKKPNPTDADIDAAMSRNICRCGTYPRIRKAIKRAAAARSAK